VEQGFSEHYGARELERVVERSLLLLLAPHVPTMIHAVSSTPQRYEITVRDGQLRVG